MKSKATPTFSGPNRSVGMKYGSMHFRDIPPEVSTARTSELSSQLGDEIAFASLHGSRYEDAAVEMAVSLAEQIASAADNR
jgi:hypothetical protein